MLRKIESLVRAQSRSSACASLICIIVFEVWCNTTNVYLFGYNTSLNSDGAVSVYLLDIIWALSWFTHLSKYAWFFQCYFISGFILMIDSCAVFAFVVSIFFVFCFLVYSIVFLFNLLLALLVTAYFVQTLIVLAMLQVSCDKYTLWRNLSLTRTLTKGHYH